MSTLAIRAATPDDLACLTELRLEFIADVRDLPLESLRGDFEQATADFLRTSIDEGALHAWLAEDDGGVVGIVAVILHLAPPHPDELRRLEGYIINVYVRPTARGRGVARALMETCLGAQDALGISRFNLHATAAGRPLYEKLGFAPDDDWLELPPVHCT